jgi:hypothetical protein
MIRTIAHLLGLWLLIAAVTLVSAVVLAAVDYEQPQQIFRTTT